MYKLDNDFLQSVGLGGLSEDDKAEMLREIYNTLELRVGMRLASQMTDAQLDEFEALIDRKDDAAALKWLETNFPNYKDVVAEELAKLREEIAADAPKILEAMGLGGEAVPAAVEPPQAA